MRSTEWLDVDKEWIKGGGKVEWKILSLGNCVVCGAMETGKTEAQMVTEVLVIYWR